MDKFNGNFDQYAMAFRLAQACRNIDGDNILVDALQQGVTNQLATMMTTTALLPGQEKTRWKGSSGSIKQESFTGMWCDCGSSGEEETAISSRPNLPEMPVPLETIPLPWMSTGSTSNPVND